MFRAVRSLVVVLVIGVAAIVVTPAASYADCRTPPTEDIVPSNTVLCPGNLIYSANGYNMLKMQYDGNLVFYRLAARKNPNSANHVWWSWKGFGEGAIAEMMTNRFFYIKADRSDSKNSQNRVLDGYSNFLKVQNDGKLVIYSTLNNIPLAQICIKNNQYAFCNIP